MNKLTDVQAAVLKRIMRGESAFITSRSPAVLRKLDDRKLWEFDRSLKYGRKLTKMGWVALHQWYYARWAKHGCMAYQQQLQEFEAKMKAAGHDPKA